MRPRWTLNYESEGFELLDRLVSRSIMKEKLELGFRVDLIVGNKVIIEIKSVEALAPVHKKQLLTYLRLMNLRLGLLLNFNVELMRNGIKRVVNGLVQ